MNREFKTTGTAYLLWALGLLAVCGVHRFYAGKPVSGLIWLLTGGLCGIGQIVDLFLIQGMIDDANAGLPAQQVIVVQVPKTD